MNGLTLLGRSENKIQKSVCDGCRVSRLQKSSLENFQRNIFGVVLVTVFEMWTRHCISKKILQLKLWVSEDECAESI